jgi:hypothetical protein
LDTPVSGSQRIAQVVFNVSSASPKPGSGGPIQSTLPVGSVAAWIA